MVMERLRPWAKEYMERAGRIAARIIPNPDYYTLLGGLLAWTTPLLAYFNHGLLAAFMIPVSALVDALDGPVARVTRGASRRGEFLDSVVDRLSDTAYFLTIYLLGVSGTALVVGVGLAVTISYVRAKGELVGASLRGVGLMERGDRTATLFLIAFLAGYHMVGLAGKLAWFMNALMAFTVVDRSMRVLEWLGSTG